VIFYKFLVIFFVYELGRILVTFFLGKKGWPGRILAITTSLNYLNKIFLVFSVESSTSQKRQRTYLVTDTPDHKQNATIITTRQEKLRKRFSFQQFNSPNTNLPIVPDTPVKSK